MDTPRHTAPAALVTFARIAVLATALLGAGCGNEERLRPNGNPNQKGYIAGAAFLAGDVEHTTQIKVEFFIAGTDQKVSTTFPNEEGRFVSDALDGGNYDVTASAEIQGYFPARIENIAVVPGRTTEVGIIDVTDSSRPQFENLAPAPSSLLPERRPVISGEFRSVGSGFMLSSFGLQVNGHTVTVSDGLDVVEIDPLHHGRFRYQPDTNLEPGQVDVRVNISNRAPGTTAVRTWSFRILEGIARRVPSEYAALYLAVGAANDGDTVLVAPGRHEVAGLEIKKDLVILGEGGREVTTLDAGLSARHLYVIGANRRVIIQGFTFVGGRGHHTEPGGAIRCDEADLLLGDCAFTGNESVDRGGALALYDSNAEVRDCVFTGNHAYRGGAIAMFDRGSPRVHNCVFSRNSVTQGLGGAMLVELATPDVHHNVFYRNDAGAGDGGAIMVDFRGDRTVLRTWSNIFVENRAGPNNHTIALNQCDLESSCDGFYGNTGNNTGGSGANITLEDMKDLLPGADPGFCNATGEDFRLEPDSPFLGDACGRGAFPPGCGR